MAAAAQGVQMMLERRGEGLLEQRKPFWFPGFAADLTFDRWLRGLDPRRVIRVVDRRLEDHDHGSYKSYQAHLVVEHDEDTVERALGGLRSQIRSDSKLFLAKSGGTVVLWGLLGLLYLWLDRLTRGYMTWRLRGLFLGMGLGLPGIAFVMI